jgi:hypothetical protein
MLAQVCGSWHGKRPRDRRVRVLVLSELRDDVKTSQDSQDANCDVDQ